METVSVKDKVDIASTFLLASPPGELNDVFNDIRTIINDDEALQKGIVSTLEQYNTEQHTTVTPPGLDYPVIISKHNQTQDGRFLDPRSNQTFSYHHMHLTAEDLQPADTEESALEPLRKALDEQAQAYVKDHFPEGVLTVVVENDQVALTLVDNKYNPNNFWNGRWLASWVYHTQSGELKGHTHVHVHYYEDGNVQLKASKDTEASLSKEDVSVPTERERDVLIPFS
ncbi:subunits of heterodimeric actin filament capping protein Capz [Hesseltinella vesiculosa]|uniref:F-actin-capping protein subunit alpha n=1 Tax=Hesseltinella vesiculosa TaxID=101127 RepID=A0A1X2G692_9FUNG|nr:subunits of heterodimeric actin filament capping protein Capz [Hesseltinella vesiculosa]